MKKILTMIMLIVLSLSTQVFAGSATWNTTSHAIAGTGSSGATGADHIRCTYVSEKWDVGTAYIGNMLVTSNPSDATKIRLVGDASWGNAHYAGQSTGMSFFGVYDGAAGISSITFLTNAGTMSGKILYREIS